MFGKNINTICCWPQQLLLHSSVCYTLGNAWPLWTTPSDMQDHLISLVTIRKVMRHTFSPRVGCLHMRICAVIRNGCDAKRYFSIIHTHSDTNSVPNNCTFLHTVMWTHPHAYTNMLHIDEDYLAVAGDWNSTIYIHN